MMSSDGNYPDIPHGSDRYGEDDHTKPCTFGGCGGTMHFKPRFEGSGRAAYSGVAMAGDMGVQGERSTL